MNEFAKHIWDLGQRLNAVHRISMGAYDPPGPAETYTCDVCHGVGLIDDPTDCDCTGHLPSMRCQTDYACCRSMHECVVCQGRGEVTP